MARSSLVLSIPAEERIQTSSRVNLSMLRDLPAFVHTPFPGSFHRHLSFFPAARSSRRPRQVRFGSPPAFIITASAITEGHVLQFQSSGRRKLGRVVRADGKRNWIIEDANGVQSSVSTKQVTYVLGEASSLGEIANIETSCTNLAADSSELLEIAWEFVSSEDGGYEANTATVDQISELVYDDTSPESLFTTYILLSEDDVFFKERVIKGKNYYEARKPAIVEEARASKLGAIERERERLANLQALVAAHDSKDLAAFYRVLGDDADTALSCFKSMAVELELGPRVEERYQSNRVSVFQRMTQQEQNLVREIMTTLNKPILPSSALNVLISLGLFSPHENLALRRADLLQLRTFSESLLLAADMLVTGAVKDLDEDTRTDLSHLTAIAIDSEDTTEVDDAISWDPESDRIYVHVADPSRYFPDGPSHPLVEEAIRRTSTLYLPAEKLTMFPETLASDLFSLNGSNSDGSALSFGFKILEDGSIEEESVIVQPTVISTPRRLTYDEVDRILPDDAHELHHILRPLLDKAKLRLNWRLIEGGAIIIKSTFGVVNVENPESEEPEVQLSIVDTSTDSWTLVSELMVTACTVAAEFAGKARLLMPYRGQEPFDYPPDEVLEAIPDGPARAAMAFRNATSSETKTEPIEHASLGLDAYVQVTSPIRRCTDLLTHFQLKSHLRGDAAAFSEADVNQVISRSGDYGRILRNVENRTRKYWQLEYLRRLGPDVLHKATFVKPLSESKTQMGVFSLDEYGMQVVATMAPGLKPGAAVEVSINVAEPRTGNVRADCITQATLATADLDTLLEDALSDISSEADFP